MNRSLRILLIVLVLAVIILVVWIFLFPRSRTSTLLTSSNPLPTSTLPMNLAIPTQTLKLTASSTFDIPTLNALATKASKTKSIEPTLQFQSPSTGTPLPTLWSCPPEGASKKEGNEIEDPLMNDLKNRTNEASKYYPILFDEIINLPTAESITELSRLKWTTTPENAVSATQVATYEGLPISVEGFLNYVEESGPETANCNSKEKYMLDWHIFLTKGKGEYMKLRGEAIVVETTPRVRVYHNWDLKTLKKIAKDQLPVRISGWLFFDQEHQEMVTSFGNRDWKRKTLWEIHPIMMIEVFWNNDWYFLDGCRLVPPPPSTKGEVVCQK